MVLRFEVRLAIRAKRPLRLVNKRDRDSLRLFLGGMVLSRGLDGGGAFDWRPRAAFHERLVLQDVVGQPLQVDAFSKRDPVAWRVRIPSGRPVARNAPEFFFKLRPCQNSGSHGSQVFALS